MPMFEEHRERDLGPIEGDRDVMAGPIPIQPPTSHSMSRKPSEESIRTEFCDGPVPDSPKPASPEPDLTNAVSDRAELIERLKRGESPTWIPNRHLESVFHQQRSNSPGSSPGLAPATLPTLMPSAAITPERSGSRQDDVEAERRFREGSNIERPGSALHSGDFTHNDSSRDNHIAQESGIREDITHFRSSSHSWISTSPPRSFTPFKFERKRASPGRSGDYGSGTSSLSSSLSQSFAYKLPTSPLVQSESNEDIDLSLPMNNIDIATSSPKNNLRRHTLHFAHTSDAVTPLMGRQSTPRNDGAHHYQAHQPRRSLTSTPSFSIAASTPQTPSYLRSRRPSYGSEASPLQHASMVGSYEESILRGRMSTTPSRPLDFQAQIGVLGLGKCKSSLRCPPHVTLPFSAVFYSYASTTHGRTKTEDGPSPYVGQIDLENGISNPEDDLRAKRKQQSRYSERMIADDGMVLEDGLLDGSEAETSRPARQKRGSRSPKAPPGGRYRIPEKGQLQVIIKNQNKTAVKLFLVPYDLVGMEAGTKTFIRQRSYSAGAVIDNVPDLQDTSISDRPVLRYLIHLHICCPSKGRYYLYKSVRVVFANRVPDGKEKLRNEVTYPEPRFSPYKPVRVMHPPVSHTEGGAAAMLTAEKAYRRRSSGYSFSHYPQAFDNNGALPVGPIFNPSIQLQRSPLFAFSETANTPPVEPIPFHLPRSRIRVKSEFKIDTKSADEEDPATRTTALEEKELGDELPLWSESDGHWGKYDKLSKGDVGYGGNAFAPDRGSRGSAEGLLSQRLRSLGVQSQAQEPDEDGKRKES